MKRRKRPFRRSDAVPATAALSASLFALGAQSALAGKTVPITINEIDVDQGLSDHLQFVELHSAAPGTPLDGLALVFYNGNLPDDSSYLAIDLDGLTTNADGLDLGILLGAWSMPPEFAGHALSS